MAVGLTAYQRALGVLYARTTGVKFGLDRTYALLEALGNPHRAYPIIHVAGTNGKGSVMAMAEALLMGRGLRVGRYTSPHLVDFRERILVNSGPLTEAHVVAFVERWLPTIERLNATFFEATTAMAFEAFAGANIDVALIETGLGGRLDSTNVVDPVVAGVTSIGWDHTEYLGPTLETIAAEKGGIFKKGKPAVIGQTTSPVRKVLFECAREAGAIPVLAADAVTFTDVRVSSAGTSAAFTRGGEQARLSTPLVGEHQAENLAFTLALLGAAGDPYAATLESASHWLRHVALPGRFHRSGKYLFDVAHNADGARVLAKSVRAVSLPEPIVVVFCALADKAWPEMIRALQPIASSFLLTNAPSAPENRRWDINEARTFIASESIAGAVEADFDAALARAGSAGTMLVTGSFHTVGDAMQRLQVSPLAP